jgi:hypothetical protein
MIVKQFVDQERMIDSTPLSSDHLFVLSHLESILPDGSFLDELVCNRLKVHLLYKFLVDVADCIVSDIILIKVASKQARAP